MNNKVNATSLEKRQAGRIHSIDALRGITLLGILLVHTIGLFGFLDYNEYISHAGHTIVRGVYFLLSNRCAPVFNMLFGVSFFLILKKPTYSSRKFLWRCILLIGIGLVNKIFYTYDALMWYGILGIALLSFRYASNRILLASAIVLRFVGIFLARYHLGDLISPPPSETEIMLKYSVTGGLEQVFSYPLWESVKDYLRIVFNGGFFSAFTNFLFGYWVAKKGYIINLEKYSNLKTVMIFGVIYFCLFILSFMTENPVSLSFSYWSGALFLALLFLYIYYKYPFCFGFLEAYGKLGLTNYTCQSLFGVVFMVLCVIPLRLDMPAILLSMMLFYALQCLFSFWWLRYFTNGPLEWLWRCLTNRNFVSPLIIR